MRLNELANGHKKREWKMFPHGVWSSLQWTIDGYSPVIFLSSNRSGGDH